MVGRDGICRLISLADSVVGIVKATVTRLFVSLRGIGRGMSLAYLMDGIIEAPGLGIGHCLR